MPLLVLVLLLGDTFHSTPRAGSSSATARDRLSRCSLLFRICCAIYALYLHNTAVATTYNVHITRGAVYNGRMCSILTRTLTSTYDRSRIFVRGTLGANKDLTRRVLQAGQISYSVFYYKPYIGMLCIYEACF